MTTHSTRKFLGVAVGATVAVGLTACGGGGGFSSGSPQNTASGPVSLKMLIGSSGPTETKAVTDAANAWAQKTGNKVQVVAAGNLAQELGKGFAGGTPSDVFYLDSARVGDYAKAGNLYAYADKMDTAKFIPNLNKAFSFQGKQQCVAKDFSTLALIINSDLWKKAGLTDADVPKSWADLESVAAKLTSGKTTGLVFSGEYARVGVFIRQAGGWFVNKEGTQMTANSPETVAGLAEVKKLLAAGHAKYAKQVDSGWGGEALIKGRGAMVIEGNWIRGALTKDAPNLKTTVVELPAGPAGKGTLTFTNCWGIAAKSKNQAQAVELVKYLTEDPQQLAFAKAFGVMPSTTTGAAEYAKQYPADAAFAAGAEYGQPPVNLPGFDPVMGAFNTKLEQLGSLEPKAILDDLQKNGQAVLGG